ncbi:MAG: hypothetical protein MZV64_72695 [Ignavibacteriales bacterium]|nr:hypothetical protein [Ignavibacteriales bacterium]
MRCSTTELPARRCHSIPKRGAESPAAGGRGAFHLPAGRTSEGHPRTNGNGSDRTRGRRRQPGSRPPLLHGERDRQLRRSPTPS